MSYKFFWLEKNHLSKHNESCKKQAHFCAIVYEYVCWVMQNMTGFASPNTTHTGRFGSRLPHLFVQFSPLLNSVAPLGFNVGRN
jgi:hypothetical protein